MRLELLEAQNVRNLHSFRLNLGPKHNVFIGDNGSGKTSILEAIHLLSVGRSFRTHLIRRVINHQQPQLSVFGSINVDSSYSLPVGIEKQGAGETKIKIAGKNVNSLAELAILLPMQVINNDSFQLLTAGPKVRRQFLDWGLFHVEQSFFSLWKQYYNVLKQRNAALKRRSDINEIKTWDSMLVSLASKIDASRKQYVVAVEKHLARIAEQLLDVSELTVSYLSGWQNDKSLLMVLEESLQRDIALGFTQFGPHRADLNIKIKNIPAEGTLSRGQQKLLVCALQLAQGAILSEQAAKSCLYLIDDLPSELDKLSLAKVIEILVAAEAQIFLTAISTNHLDKVLAHQDSKLFHVKHGAVTEASSLSLL